MSLDIVDVSKRFALCHDTVHVLSHITLHVETGEFVAIVGASGCGKSTLLRLILGLDTDHDGQIFTHGVPVRAPGLDRGMVFQEHRLLPWLTVADNVGAALRRSSLSRAERRARVAEHLELVGLTRFAQAYPSQLSGGMAQRAALARALVNQPPTLLLDEPLGALDALTRLRLQDELKRIVRDGATTTVLVTHDVDEAVYLADRIVVMQPHPGRIAAVVDVKARGIRSRSDPAFIDVRDEVLDMLGVGERMAA